MVGDRSENDIDILKGGLTTLRSLSAEFARGLGGYQASCPPNCGWQRWERRCQRGKVLDFTVEVRGILFVAIRVGY